MANQQLFVKCISSLALALGQQYWSSSLMLQPNRQHTPAGPTSQRVWVDTLYLRGTVESYISPWTCGEVLGNPRWFCWSSVTLSVDSWSSLCLTTSLPVSVSEVFRLANWSLFSQFRIALVEGELNKASFTV